MCRVFSLHRSGFYAWLDRPLCNRAIEDQRLLKLINESYLVSGATYGSPWIHRDLLDSGEYCSVHRVAKIMRTNKLRSYGVAHRDLMPDVIHNTSQYANNRAEQSHEATRVRESGVRWSDISEFKSVKQAQRFLGAHAAVYSLFNLGRHLARAEHYRNLREGAFAEWGRAVA